MEHSPFSQFEDDDDENEKKTSKKSTKVPRRLPLGLEVDTAQEAAETEEKKPPTIAERLGELFEKKNEEKDEEEKHQTVEKSEPSEDEVVITPEGITESGEVENPTEEVIADEESWPDEGDLSEVNEIRLNRPTAHIDAPASLEIVPHEADEPEPTPAPEVVQPQWAETAEVTLAAEAEPETAHEEPAVEASHEDVKALPAPPAVKRTSEPEPEPVPFETTHEDESMSNMALFNRERERVTRSEVDPKAIERDLNEAEYRGEKRGQSRGVVTGLFFGWLFGRHGKKKMERKYEKQLDIRDKEIKGLNDEQFAAQERLQAIKRNQERLQADMLRNEAGPILVAQEALSGKEQIQSKDKPAGKELPPEDREINEDTYKTSKGHHVETSTWHRIETDLKTGKIVENPDVAYGQEFQHETKQEVLREDRRQDDAPAALQLGSVATLSPQDDSTPYDNQNDGQPSSGINFSLPKTDLPAGKQVRSYIANPITWAIALVLVLALIIFGFLS